MLDRILFKDGKRQAFATEHTPPIDLAQARLLVERYLVPEVGAQPAGARMHAVEFQSCFTVVKVLPSPPVEMPGL